MPEMQDRRRVRHRVAGQIDPGKAAQRLAVVQRILHRFVGQPVPLLHKIDPQHPLQRDRRPAALAFRIERAQGAPPAATTAPPAPSRPETYRAASASSCRRTPPRQNSPDAASICPRSNTGQILPNPGPETGLFQRIPRGSFCFFCYSFLNSCNIRHRPQAIWNGIKQTDWYR